MATTAEPNAIVDWPDRYAHIDQILENAGPRTDPAFAAGDEVRGRDSCGGQYDSYTRPGQKLSSHTGESSCHWRWWARMRDPGQPSAYRLQGHPCY